MPECIKGLARNLDWHTGFHGTEIGKEPVVNILGITPDDFRNAKPEEVAKVKMGEAELFTIHIAEGKAGDPQTRTELGLLKDAGLLTNRTAIIHGVALTGDDFKAMAKAGASLVWSPRSNMVLYGETADVLGALRAGVRVAIAPDWSPTGSDSLLDELAFAASLMRARKETEPAKTLSSKQLFEMATRVPAEIARIDKQVGSLVPGLRADLFVLKNERVRDPYDALVQTGAAGITLVLVEGVPVYGDAASLNGLNVGRTEQLSVCGIAKAVNSQSLGGGSLADVARRIGNVLSANGSALAPLVELCR
jgi:cytosine/adenosine deaminase-related metal-dependent hydrolase